MLLKNIDFYQSFVTSYILVGFISLIERGRTAAGSFDLRKVSPPSKHTNTCEGYRARARAVALQLMCSAHAGTETIPYHVYAMMLKG